MRGQRVDHAFSNYDRFKKPTKYEKEALEYNREGFSIIDVHDMVFTHPAQHPHFSKQVPRTDMFLRPELLKVVEAEKVRQKARQQRMQQMYNELGTKAGEEMSTWKINFGYESHKNVKDLRTMMRTLIEVVKEMANETKLSHTENLHMLKQKQSKNK